MWNPFKKEEKPKMPSKFALIRYSKHAKERGLDDDDNKIIEIYKKGRLSEPAIPYSEEVIRSLIEIEEIPVIPESFINDEEYEFESTANFGNVEVKR